GRSDRAFGNAYHGQQRNCIFGFVCRQYGGRLLCRDRNHFGQSTGRDVHPYQRSWASERARCQRSARHRHRRGHAYPYRYRPGRLRQHATNYTGTVASTTTDPGVGLPATFTFTTANQGTASFPLTFDVSGTLMVTVTDTVDPTLTAQATVDVLPGNAT